jgi:hypothetical protein
MIVTDFGEAQVNQERTPPQSLRLRVFFVRGGTTAKRIHVVPSSNRKWDVKQERAKGTSVHTRTKADAVKAAMTIAKNQHEVLVIHNRRGEISDADSLCPDPHPPLDKNH